MASSVQQRLGERLGITTSQHEGGRFWGARRIDKVGDFSFFYSLCESTLPSNHKGVEIRHAKRVRDSKEVIVKIRLKPQCFSDAVQERTWRRNTEFMLNLPSSRHIVRMLEVLEDTNAIYVVMEKAEGLDLHQILCKEHCDISLSTARGILRHLLEAVKHLHENNAVHKDLKLENIVVDAGERASLFGDFSPKAVKIIDFDTVEEWTPSTPPSSRYVLGTDRYIAQ